MRARLILTLTVAVVAAPAPAAAAEPLATCFWEGPVSMKRPTSRGFDGRGFNFPEESATYWLARFRLPQGTRLRLPRALLPRALSVDQRILRWRAHRCAAGHADRARTRGSVNPFVAGSRRDVAAAPTRSAVWTRIVPSTGLRAPNTLYASGG